MSNYTAVECKPLYIPFDYSYPPAKEYIPPIPSLEDTKHLDEDTKRLLTDLKDIAPELFE